MTGKVKGKKIIIHDARGTDLYNKMKEEAVQKLRSLANEIENSDDIIVQNIKNGTLKHKQTELSEGIETGFHGLEVNYFVPSECKVDEKYVEIVKQFVPIKHRS
jgi:TATA-box binding protein (TBP) (component of TFIID and TFIIIB)